MENCKVTVKTIEEEMQGGLTPTLVIHYQPAGGGVLLDDRHHGAKEEEHIYVILTDLIGFASCWTGLG